MYNIERIFKIKNLKLILDSLFLLEIFQIIFELIKYTELFLDIKFILK